MHELVESPMHELDDLGGLQIMFAWYGNDTPADGFMSKYTDDATVAAPAYVEMDHNAALLKGPHAVHEHGDDFYLAGYGMWIWDKTNVEWDEEYVYTTAPAFPQWDCQGFATHSGDVHAVGHYQDNFVPFGTIKATHWKRTGAGTWTVQGQSGSATGNTAYCALSYGGSLYIGGEWAQWNAADDLIVNASSGYSSLGAITDGGGQGSVYNMCEWDGKLVAVGEFDDIGGSTYYDIAAYNGSWSSLGTEAGDTIVKIVSCCSYNGNLIVCGNFTKIGGVDVRHVAMYNAADGWAAMPGIDPAADPYSSVTANDDFAVLFQADPVSGNTELKRWDGATWTDIGGAALGVSAVATLENSGQVIIYTGSPEA